VTLVQAAGGLLLLYLGGEALIRGASGLAARLGVSAMAIGLTVVAFGTSAPELVVSLEAVLGGVDDISIGNVVGSNIANIALILGITVILRPAEIEARIVQIDAPVMVFASLSLVAVLTDGEVTRPEGSLLVLALFAYTGFTFWEARREPTPVKEAFAAAAPALPGRGLTSGLFVLAGLACLVGGGQLLVISAVQIATSFDVSQATVGLTVVAVGTSLPELTTSVMASARGQGDIAIGNVVGSNIFNVFCIMGVTALIHPIGLGDISWIDLGIMVGLASVVAVLLLTRHRLGRAEGVALVLTWVVYTGWLLVF
jgi:cation:H+ antiporter